MTLWFFTGWHPVNQSLSPIIINTRIKNSELQARMINEHFSFTEFCFTGCHPVNQEIFYNKYF